MTTDFASTLQLRLRADLKTAMQERRSAEVSVLRSLIAAIDDAQAVPVGDRQRTHVVRQFGDGSAEVPRLALSRGDLAALLAKEIAERRAAAAEFQRHGKDEQAGRLTDEIAVIERFVT